MTGRESEHIGGGGITGLILGIALFGKSLLVIPVILLFAFFGWLFGPIVDEPEQYDGMDGQDDGSRI